MNKPAKLTKKPVQRRPIVLIPYRVGSRSARALAERLTTLLHYRVRRLFIDRPNPTFTPREWTKVINWGASDAGRFVDLSHVSRVINPSSVITVAGNKLSTFEKLKDVDGIRIPTFTTDRSVAESWLRDGIDVVCRTQLSGHSGAGIVLSTKDNPIVAAPLYVQYVKKQKEFRVHVAFGEVIDVQEKRKRSDLPEDFATNFQVRNHQTGWVYCRENIEEPRELRGMAQSVVARLGLDFGAVDIIYNAKSDACYCLEVNTAPGLEGTTVEKYAQAFVKELT